MTFPVIRVPDEAGETMEWLGTKPKFWFDANRRLYKEGRPGTGENWAEKVACEICQLLGLPHARYDLALWHQRPGVVTDSFVPPRCRFVAGNELLSKLHPGYEAQTRYQRRQHTVLAFIALGTGSPIEPPDGYDPPAFFTAAADVMVGYLMLDCLIGNQDRHDENWGLIVCPGTPARLFLAPTFDHASSLGRNERDESRRFRLETKDSGASVERYSAKARSAFYGHPEATKTMTTLEAFAVGARQRREAARYWLDRLSAIGSGDFEAIFREIPGDWISELAILFALRMLEANKARLLATRLGN